MTGKTIGQFEIVEKIGEGGMGEVWLAEDTVLERKVVLKFLPRHLSITDSDEARFLQEARAAARLNHPNIVQIHEMGEVDERSFIVMEYMEGGSLRNRLNEVEGGPIPIQEVVDWTLQTSEGLKEAHNKGIIHRDIKPDNLMLGPKGQVKITDFGLARIKSSPRLTQSGAMLNTAAYASPEQVKGIDVDYRSDLFSLGATFYELLTGENPFNADDIHAIYYAITAKDPDSPSSLRSDVSPELDEIVIQLLQKNPEERYQSAEEIASDLKAIAAGREKSSGIEPEVETSEEVKRRIVIADDDSEIRQMIAELLETEGWEVQQAENGQEAIELVRERVPMAVLLDLSMPVKDGQETLEELKVYIPELPVVILSGEGDIERAVSAMKSGAFDFITKPPDPEHLLLVLDRSIENRMRDIELAESRLRNQSKFILVGGKSPAMAAFIDKLGRATTSDSTIMLIGETGSGKELAARIIWSKGRRAAAPFIGVNCGLLPDDYIEMTLFGFESESPSDDQGEKRGRVEEADGGTLFLDKIEELPPVVQSQLVNVLEAGEFRRVGGRGTRSTDLRLIAASTADLNERVEAGDFREDLYHHLSVVILSIPPLRECMEDLPDMVDHYLEHLCTEMGKPVPELSEEIWDCLRAYNWPGNNRELRNTLERALVLSTEGVLSPEFFPPQNESGKIRFTNAKPA